jgi:uncharacterized protein YndB with AHSA1/START domain
MGQAKVTAEPGQATVIIERTFDAPRDKVFKAMTTKELVEKWWIGPGYDIRVEELDPRDGGTWKYVQSKDGQEISFFGSFHEVSPERVIQTFEFDGLGERGHVSMDKMELTETPDGKTAMHITSTFFSVADRDGMLQSGMEEGMNNTYDALEKVLKDI